jgi:patatin-like phospholipase/acyl hydrolase
MNFEELIRLYSRKGHLIFPKPSVRFGSGIRQMRSYKYEPDNLMQILLEFFGDTTMRDMLRPTVITSYDIGNHKPFIFRMYPREKQVQGWKDFYIRDAGRSTSAAPTYFPPAHISPVGSPDKKYVLVDGGVVLNNPALLAYAEAKAMFPHAEKFVILSLGTGLVPSTHTYEETKNWGLWGWMNPKAGLPLMEIMMSGQSTSANYMLNQMPDVEIYRLNVHLDPQYAAMDKPAKENVDYLQRVAAQQVHQSFDWLKSVCQRIAGIS